MVRIRVILPLLLVVSSLLSGCSGRDVINALVPDEGYRILSGLRYGAGPRQRLDLYVPEGADGPVPLVVFFYGGNWQSGSREDYRFVGQAFASRGYAVAIPDYRLYPQIRYPGFLEDAAAAVAWLLRNRERTGVTPAPVYLAGHSAGGYIAAMLSLDPDWLAAAGISLCETVAAGIGLAGPYDFLPLRSADLKDIFGPEETRARTQPVNHVDGDEPPLLLITGDEDRTVLPRNARRLAERIRRSGGEAEVLVYAGVGHIELVASLADPLRFVAPTLDDADAFLSRHRQAGSRGCARPGS